MVTPLQQILHELKDLRCRMDKVNNDILGFQVMKQREIQGLIKTIASKTVCQNAIQSDEIKMIGPRGQGHDPRKHRSIVKCPMPEIIEAFSQKETKHKFRWEALREGPKIE